MIALAVHCGSSALEAARCQHRRLRRQCGEERLRLHDQLVGEVQLAARVGGLGLPQQQVE